MSMNIIVTCVTGDTFGMNFYIPEELAGDRELEDRFICDLLDRTVPSAETWKREKEA